MDPTTQEKAAFGTSSGLYEWNVMPLGLCNAPSTFERLMELVLIGLHWKTCLSYLDDVIVMAETFEQRIERLEEVFVRLASAGLKLKPKKCSLFQKSVPYLGHIVTEEGIKADAAKVSQVQTWPVPESATEVNTEFCRHSITIVQADRSKLGVPVDAPVSTSFWVTEGISHVLTSLPATRGRICLGHGCIESWDWSCVVTDSRWDWETTRILNQDTIKVRKELLRHTSRTPGHRGVCETTSPLPLRDQLPNPRRSRPPSLSAEGKRGRRATGTMDRTGTSGPR